MKYLLFVEDCPYDHDPTMDDFVASFERVEDAIKHYDSMHGGWPYIENCRYEGCTIDIHPVSKQRIHIHDGNEHLVISRPNAIISSWDGNEIKVQYRRKFWPFVYKKTEWEGWVFEEEDL